VDRLAVGGFDLFDAVHNAAFGQSWQVKVSRAKYKALHAALNLGAGAIVGSAFGCLFAATAQRPNVIAWMARVEGGGLKQSSARKTGSSGIVA
jgi:hypothetical protein